MRRSVSIGSIVNINHALANIIKVTQDFEDTGVWFADIELSIVAHRSKNYAIPTEIFKALMKLFRTIINNGKQPFLCQSDDSSHGDSKAAMGFLILELYPNIVDDSNFRGILEAATKALRLHSVILNGYGKCYHRGTVGFYYLVPSRDSAGNSERQNVQNQHRGPSLWDHIGSSDSLLNFYVMIHGTVVGGDTISANPEITDGLPQLWDAVRRNKSLKSLTAYLYCDDCVNVQPFLPELPPENHAEAASAMKSLSESLKGHPSLNKLEIRYRADVEPNSLLVPHLNDIVESTNIADLTLEHFPLYVSRDQYTFPVMELLKSISKGRRQVKVLRLRNLGLTHELANQLFHHLPDYIQVLDLSNNLIADFPSATYPRRSSELLELNLWKNSCLYNSNQESSLKNILSLLKERPCLADFGPWGRWQCRSRLPRASATSEARDEDLEDANNENLLRLIEVIADQNRCKTRFLPRNKIFRNNPSLWPIAISQIESKIRQHGYQVKILMGESSQPEKQRQASVIFSLLRDNLSGGAI